MSDVQTYGMKTDSLSELKLQSSAPAQWEARTLNLVVVLLFLQ